MVWVKIHLWPCRIILRLAHEADLVKVTGDDVVAVINLPRAVDDDIVHAVLPAIRNRDETDGALRANEVWKECAEPLAEKDIASSHDQPRIPNASGRLGTRGRPPPTSTISPPVLRIVITYPLNPPTYSPPSPTFIFFFFLASSTASLEGR